MEVSHLIISRSRIYISSLGVILYIMLLGEFAFTGASDHEIMEKILNDEVDFEGEDITDEGAQLLFNQ